MTANGTSKSRSCYGSQACTRRAMAPTQGRRGMSREAHCAPNPDRVLGEAPIEVHRFSVRLKRFILFLEGGEIRIVGFGDHLVSDPTNGLQTVN